MSERFRIPRVLARQLKVHGVPELAVLRRAGLWDGWLRQEKILASTEEVLAFWRAIEEVSGDPTIGLKLGPNSSLLGFDDTNSFFRAFQRWEGVSPHRWRCGHPNSLATEDVASR